MKFIKSAFSKENLKKVFVVILISAIISIPNAFFYTLNYFSYAPDERQDLGGVLGVTDYSAVLNFPQTDGEVYAMALSEDGNTLYIGGSFNTVTDSLDSYSRNYLAAIDLETLTVKDWNPNPSYYIYAIEVIGSNIYVGGSFSEIGGVVRKDFARFNGDTGEVADDCICNTYTDPGELMTIYSLYSDGTYLYIGGSFDVFCDSEIGTYNNLGRINLSSCEADTGWNPSPNGNVYSLDGDGSGIFVGGAFSEIGGATRNEFAKLSSSDGSADASCNPNFWTDEYENTSTVYSINAGSEHIYVGGSFDKYGGSEGTVRNEIARLNNDSSCTLDDWDPNLSHTWSQPRTSSILTSESDVFIGGIFDTLGGDSRNGLALVESTSNSASTWNPNLGDGYIKDMIFSDEYMIIGGYFSSVGENENVANLAAFPYTPPVSEVTTVTTSLPSTSSGPETVQIPEMTTNLQGPVVINPIKDSNTGGQEVIAVIFPEVFNFNAFFSANEVSSKNIALGTLSTPVAPTTGSTSTSVNQAVLNNTVFAGGGDSTILGIKKSGAVLWQVGNVQEMWLKAYPAPGHDAPRIIPELQEKTSIIALKYTKSDLVPPGFPKTKFSEAKLKIAHSLDGKNWTTLASSVVDPITNTVAAIGKIGGYYMIVGSY